MARGDFRGRAARQIYHVMCVATARRRSAAAIAGRARTRGGGVARRAPPRTAALALEERYPLRFLPLSPQDGDVETTTKTFARGPQHERAGPTGGSGARGGGRTPAVGLLGMCQGLLAELASPGAEVVVIVAP